MPEAPSPEYKLLSVSARHAEDARQKPPVQEALEEGWQVRSVSPLNAPSEEGGSSAAEEASPAGDDPAGSQPQTYLVKLERTAGQGSNAWLPWRSSGGLRSRAGRHFWSAERRYGPAVVALLAIVVLLEAMVLFLDMPVRDAPIWDTVAAWDAPAWEVPDWEAPDWNAPDWDAVFAWDLFGRGSEEARRPETPEAASRPAATEAPARLSLTTRPAGATVLVNHDTVGRAPLQARALAAGTYVVSVRRDGHAPLDTVVALRAGQSAHLALALRNTTAAPGLATRAPEGAAGALAADEAAAGDDAPARAEAPPSQAESSPQAAPPGERVAASEEAAAEEGPAEDPASATEPPLATEPPSVTELPSGATGERAAEFATRLPADTASVATRAREALRAPRPGVLRFVAQPTGTTVEVDGQALGQTPLRVTGVPAGVHELTLRSPGHEPRTGRVTVLPGSTHVVETPLTPLTGTLRVTVEPWGRIYIDGTLHEDEADARYTASLPVGRHRVAVVHPQLGRWEKTVRISSGETQSLTVNFNAPTSSAPAAVPDTAAAAAAARPPGLPL